MKKTLPLALITALLTLSLALAQLETVTLPAPGILPGDIYGLYGLDTAIDNLLIALTTDKILRTKRMLEVADERLSEAYTLLEIGQNDLANTALADEQSKEEQAKTILNNQLTAEEITKNIAEVRRLQSHMSNRENALKAVIQKIETDNNPNNDHALSALRASLERNKATSADTETVIKITNEELKSKGYPSLEAIEGKAKANDQLTAQPGRNY